MSDHNASQVPLLEGVPLDLLIHRFKEAESALHNALDGQIDAVLDPVTATPILLQDAQKHLVGSEARYQRLLSRSVFLVFELDADGTTLFVNDAVAQMLGYTVLELVGRNWWDTFLVGLQYHQRDDLYTRFHTGDVTHYELSVTTRQGATVILELSSVNRRKLDGTLDRILGLAIDVTERRKVELELSDNYAFLERMSVERMDEMVRTNQTLQDLANLHQRLLEIEQIALAESEHSNRMKLQFLSMVSHELRTPLASIKGFTTTLLATDVTFPPETQQKFVSVIDRETDKLSELIEQLLDLSRIQSGTLHVQPEPCGLDQILDTATAQLEAVAAQHQLVISVLPDLPPILADVQRIAGVLVNLVGNAAKFSPPGTRITIFASQKDGSLQVDVSDEGPGIAVEIRTKVFETFWQPEQRTHHHIKGAGLGLAICQGIIMAHGGSIWVADTQSGTTMSFTLPIASPR